MPCNDMGSTLRFLVDGAGELDILLLVLSRYESKFIAGCGALLGGCGAGWF